MKMIRYEIGSEFWNTPLTDKICVPMWEKWSGDQRFFLSGRTALSAVLDDILTEQRCKTAYLPSYCCHTMIEPFLAHGIAVEFYPVVFENGQLVQAMDPAKECDVVLAMDYFGFAGQRQPMPKRSVVIQDMTHSLFAEPHEADYLFASFRKWGAVAGAAVASKKGQWNIEAPIETNQAYIEVRQKGYERKYRFMSGETVDKQAFLNIFAEAEALLEKDYHGYTADKKSIDAATHLQSCAKNRRANARYLLKGLKNVDFIQPMFSVMGDSDVPLFVPILVKNGQRDELRKHLTDHDIYCPVHWPLSQYHAIDKCCKTLYEEELSLVCDQRYDTDDMQRVIDTVLSFDRR